MEIEDYNGQNTQIIREVDVKLNKWHIAMEKLYRKPTKTEPFFFKYDPTVGFIISYHNHVINIFVKRHGQSYRGAEFNHAPKTQQARALPMNQQATR